MHRLAYKKNIDDTRESPAGEIMDLLQAKGAHIDYSDPHVRTFPRKRDCHLLQHAQLIVDTRGRLGQGARNVVAA